MTTENPTTPVASATNKAFGGDYPRIITAPPGPNAKAIIDLDEKYSSTSYIKVYPLAVSHGEGPVIEDVDGNRYLDFMAGIAVAATGYSHPKVVDAVREAASKFFHICGTDFYYEPMSLLCERLANIGLGSSKKRVFLTNSGTEAVEGAIKLVRNSTGRKDLIAFQRAFHGRTYGAMSLDDGRLAGRSTILRLEGIRRQWQGWLWAVLRRTVYARTMPHKNSRGSLV